MGRHEILLDIDELPTDATIDPRDAMRILRNEMGMTVRELGIRAGIRIGSHKPYSEAYTRNVELKNEEASETFLRRTSKVLGISYETLISMNKSKLLEIVEIMRSERQEELTSKYIN